MIVVLVRTAVVALLAALCWAVIFVAFIVWGLWGGIALVAVWLAAGLLALYWRGR